MDKKKEMVFNLNNFLLAFSELLNTKRSTYISVSIALKLKFTPEKISDICSYSLAFLLGKDALNNFDFLDKNNLNNKEFLNICEFSQKLINNFDFSKNSLNQKQKCIEFVRNENFDENIKNTFLEISNKLSFWLDLENENEIVLFIYSNLNDFTKVLTFEEILKMSSQFHYYQNPQSEILKRASLIADFFEFEHKDKQIFLIASSLQNIGKLNISKTILEKKESLNEEEKEILKSYSYHTKRVLNSIMGFSDICNLSLKVQERLDGSGSFSLDAKDLSFKDRLLICLVIYSALREKKAYRNSFSHSKAIEIMKNESKNNKIDESIVEIFDKLFN